MFTNGLYLTRDKFSHAYLFFGPKSPKKFLVAQCLANYLENKKWEEPKKILLDALIVDGGGIDAVREIKNFLWQKPFKSSRRTAIIKNGSELTPQAQNALLKIAEEPPPHGLLILITEQPEALLPTVVSRFQKIYFPYKPKPYPSNPTPSHALESVLADDNMLEEYVTVKMSELAKDPIRNYRALKALLERWTYIKQFNVNKKLQIDAFLASF